MELSFQLVKKFFAFVEPEGSLPSLQKPTNNPYPEPDESNPDLPILFF
jgi:hypothetical protein